jgi:hypothetical protein
MDHFSHSQGSVRQRALTLMKAAGVGPPRGACASHVVWDVELGDPDLVLSGRRRRVIGQRDQIATGDW